MHQQTRGQAMDRNANYPPIFATLIFLPLCNDKHVVTRLVGVTTFHFEEQMR